MCDRDRYGGAVSGQATLEYALVLFALLASIAAMGTVIAFLQGPSSFDSICGSSAHVLGKDDLLGHVQDAAVF